MAISDWIHNNIGGVSQDTSIYKSGSESVKIYNLNNKCGCLLLNKSGTTNIGEGMITSWCRTDSIYQWVVLLFRAKSSKGYSSDGFPNDCYCIIANKSDGYVYKFINGNMNELAQISGHGFNENTWFMLRVKWYKDSSGNLVIVLDKSSDGSSWTNLAVETDPSPAFEGDTERRVGVGGYGTFSCWFDLTKIYKA